MNNKIQIKGIIVKKLYDDTVNYNKGFKVYTVCLLPEYANKLKQQNIVISGIVPNFCQGETVSLECSLIEFGKYAGGYKVENVIIDKDYFNSNKYTKFMLQRLGYSDNTIENITKVYPNICKNILDNDLGNIYVEKIKGFNEKNLKNLIEKVKKNQEEFVLISEFPEYNFTFSTAKNILALYHNVRNFKENLSKDIYDCLCKVDGIGFKKADEIILKSNPSLKISKTRLASFINYLLQEEENSGSTYLFLFDCFSKVRELLPECEKFFAEVIKDENKFFLDNENKKIARRNMYEIEKKIYNKLISANSIEKDFSFNVENFNKTKNGVELSSDQKKILSLIEKNPISILSGFAGCGKAQPYNAKVLTKNGFVKMKNIKKGDKVYGIDGKLYTVLNTFDQGVKPIYQIIFHDKTRTKCCAEHLWQITEHKAFSKVKKVIELQDILNERLTREDITSEDKFDSFMYRFSIPVCGKIEFKEKKVLVPPDILGQILSNKKISKADQFKLLNFYGVDTKFLFIPKDYLFNSIENRISLLNNLKDEFNNNDGNSYCQITTKSKILKKQIKFLIRSLGGVCVEFKDKRNYIIRYKFNVEDKFIKEIKYIGEKPCKCIAVNSPNNLYITDEFIVTHNTLSVSAITEMLKDNNKTFALLAPTGRASKVLSENTGYPAFTIHKFLGVSSGQEISTIEEDFVICDEATMIDLSLMLKLLNKIDFNKTSIIFVCDPAQLLSVGTGNVLSNMIESDKFPSVTLQKVFRYNEGGISFVATEIRNGKNFLKDFDNTNNIVLGNKKDYIFYNREDCDIINLLKDIYLKIKDKENFNISEIVTLTAYNKGDFGTVSLNNIIQEMINPKTNFNYTGFSKQFNDEIVEFRINDKVIQTVNDYKVQTINKGEGSVFNGEDGVITGIYTDKENKPYLRINFNGVEYIYSKAELGNIMLGYCISIHKSQGSTFKNIIVISPNSHKFFSTRNLLYVACTRAKDKVIHIGSSSLVSSAVRKNETKQRKNFLIDFLKGVYNE